MGNNYSNNDAFKMHIKFIGHNMQSFISKVKKSDTLHNIIKSWEIEPLENIDVSKQINTYFKRLQKIKADENNKDISLRECLILKVNNEFDPEINCIIEKINELDSYQYAPLVLILTSEYSNNEIKIDTEKYEYVDPRLLFVERYTEDPQLIEDKIIPILLRFCSIHNELGDVFGVEEGKNEQKIDLIERAFPFNLNIACIGRFGQGKSTGVNQILGEYKAKESNKGCSQTKNITFYQVKNKPIRILDVPGFESPETVKEAVDKFEKFRQKLNFLKDRIHIILYFLNYSETRTFMELEYPILEEITQHESAQIIYVMTHSKSKNPKSKNKIFDKINSGIQGVMRNKPIKNNIEKFKATERNVVFVNFHYDEDNETEPFGKKELFKKIYDFFVESKDYKESYKRNSSKEAVEETALKLRAQAESILLPNKIWGAVVGIIPAADWALQKFVINKNAVKKVGQIFGIDAKFIDEDNEKEKKFLEKKDMIYYTTPGLSDDSSNSYIIGNQLIEQGTEYKVGKTAECITHAGEYVTGIPVVGYGISAAAKSVQLSAQAVEFSAQAAQLSAQATQLGAKAIQYSTTAAQITDKINNADKLTKLIYYITGIGTEMTKEAANLSSKASSALSAAKTASAAASSAASSASSTAIAASSAATAGTLGKVFGIGLPVVGIVVGVGCGAYFTHKFCEETLDKYVEYYKKNSGKIQNSYVEAAEYFLK